MKKYQVKFNELLVGKHNQHRDAAKKLLLSLAKEGARKPRVKGTEAYDLGTVVGDDAGNELKCWIRESCLRKALDAFTTK